VAHGPLTIVATIVAGFFQLFVPQFLGPAVDQAYGVLHNVGQDSEAAEAVLLTTALLLLGRPAFVAFSRYCRTISANRLGS